MAGYIGKAQGVTQVDGYNRSEADAEFVQVAGDTMTGALAVNGNLTVDTDTLFVDAASNRVGVGTSSPPFTFVAASDSTDGGYIFSSSAVSVLGLGGYSGGGDGSFSLRYARASGDITFNGGTRDTPTERMRITSAGNVGIGTSSPSATQHTRNNSAGAEVARFEGQYAGGGSVTLADFRRDGGAVAASVQYTDSPISINIGTTTSHPFVFKTGGTERARIDASGNLLVGATSLPSASVKGSAFLNDANQGRLYVAADNTGARDLAYWINPNGVVGTITTTGSATAYNTSSDYRLKENVVPLAGAADRLAQIPVHRFNFIANPDRTVDGFLAHEVQAFVPECVTGEKDQVETVEVTDEDGNITTEERPVYQGIDQSKLVPLLTAALQEALTEIADLKARVANLEGGAA